MLPYFFRVAFISILCGLLLAEVLTNSGLNYLSDEGH